MGLKRGTLKNNTDDNKISHTKVSKIMGSVSRVKKLTTTTCIGIGDSFYYFRLRIRG